MENIYTGMIKPKNEFIEIKKRRNDRWGIDFDAIYSLSEDNEQNLWAGTNLGVYVFNPSRQKFTVADIESFSQKKIIDGNINGFIETKEGTVIALGWGGDGLYFYDSLFNRIPDRYGYLINSPMAIIHLPGAGYRIARD